MAAFNELPFTYNSQNLDETAQFDFTDPSIDDVLNDFILNNAGAGNQAWDSTSAYDSPSSTATLSVPPLSHGAESAKDSLWFSTTPSSRQWLQSAFDADFMPFYETKADRHTSVDDHWPCVDGFNNASVVTAAPSEFETYNCAQANLFGNVPESWPVSDVSPSPASSITSLSYNDATLPIYTAWSASVPQSYGPDEYAAARFDAQRYFEDVDLTHSYPSTLPLPPIAAPVPQRACSRQSRLKSRLRRAARPRNEQSDMRLTSAIPRNAHILICRHENCGRVFPLIRRHDFKRHEATHAPASVWICCGVPAEKAGEYGLDSRDAVEYRGRLFVGGCWKFFSRKDSLRRHLAAQHDDEREGKCVGNLDKYAVYAKLATWDASA